MIVVAIFVVTLVSVINPAIARVNAVNATALSAEVKQLQSTMQQQQITIQKHSDLLHKLSKVLKLEKQDILKFSGMCEVTAWNKCFFGIFVGNGRITQYTAEKLCEQRNAKLGNVYSEKHYERLMNYLRPWLGTQTSSRIAIRTGMTINPKTKISYLSNGNDASTLTWTKGYPSSSSSYTSVGLYIYEVGSVYNGLYNTAPTTKEFGVLCEISL